VQLTTQLVEVLTVNVGWAIVELLKVPLQDVLHEYVKRDPSGSLDPVPSNATVVVRPVHSSV
jgi:hypothetical protein